MIIYVQSHTYNHRRFSDYLTLLFHLPILTFVSPPTLLLSSTRCAYFILSNKNPFEVSKGYTSHRDFLNFLQYTLAKKYSTRAWPYLFIANMGHLCGNWGLKKLEDVPWVWIVWIGLDAGEATWNLQTTLWNGDGNWGCINFIFVSIYVSRLFETIIVFIFCI